ncbi:MAG: acyltransferase family protein [Oscillospiraceae bacterium]
MLIRFCLKKMMRIRNSKGQVNGLESVLQGNSSTAKKRYVVFDNLKFLLIIFVVLGHLSDECIGVINNENNNALQWYKIIFLFVYAFHMPLFLFVSGLFQNRNAEKINKNSIIFYVIMGFLLKMLITVSKLLFKPEETRPFSLLDQSGAYWFLFVLAGYKVLCYFIKDVNPVLITVFSVLMALFVGYDSNTGDWMYLSRFIVFFPFYYFGFILKPEQVINFCSKIYIRIISVILIGVWLWFCIFDTDLVYPLRGLFTGRNSYSRIGSIENCNMWHRALAMLISILLCAAFISICTNKKIPHITKLGKRTLQVYFWHQFFIFAFVYLGLYKPFMHYFPNSWWVIGMFIGVLLTFILSAPIFGKPISWIENAVKNNKRSD